jgi:hypothetical protein
MAWRRAASLGAVPIELGHAITIDLMTRPVGSPAPDLTRAASYGLFTVGGDAFTRRNHRPTIEAKPKLPQTGGCQCGKVRYEITQEPQSVYTCHCTACQRLTSSAFSMGLVVAETALRLSGIEPKPLQRVADSGRINTRLVCPECGSWICGVPRDGVVRVRAGSLDDTSWLRPTRHIWTRSKQPWITFAEGDEIFEAQPPA